MLEHKGGQINNVQLISFFFVLFFLFFNKFMYCQNIEGAITKNIHMIFFRFSSDILLINLYQLTKFQVLSLNSF